LLRNVEFIKRQVSHLMRKSVPNFLNNAEIVIFVFIKQTKAEGDLYSRTKRSKCTMCTQQFFCGFVTLDEKGTNSLSEAVIKIGGTNDRDRPVACLTFQ